MVKVATPILYESSLGELNRVRPLQLSEKSRFSLDLPVLCKNPVGTDRPIIGKLARCDERGALLRNTGNSFKNYQIENLNLYYWYDHAQITFSQKIFGVLIKFTKSAQATSITLKDSLYNEVVWIAEVAGCYFIPFAGRNMYFQGFGAGQWSMMLSIYGFF